MPLMQMEERLRKISYGIIILFILLILPSPADEKETDTQITNRYPDKERLQHYLQDSEFQYEQVIIEEISLIRAIIYWLQRKIFELISFDGSGGIFSIIMISGLILIILYIILNMVLPENPGLFLKNRYFRRKKTWQESIENSGEDIDAVITEARRKGDYQRVIYLLFLKILNQLHKKGIIQFRPEKTNRDYIIEVGDHLFMERFRGAAIIHESVRYGNLLPDEKTMLGFVNHYDQFSREIDEK
jgi:hypothetical protein